MNGCNSRKREKKTRLGSDWGRRILISCQTRAGPVQGSIFVPLFQLKVPPRLGGPPICPGPYAPAYTDAMPLGACYDYGKNRKRSVQEGLWRAAPNSHSRAELSVRTFLSEYLSNPSAHLPGDGNDLHETLRSVDMYRKLISHSMFFRITNVNKFLFK